MKQEELAKSVLKNVEGQAELQKKLLKLQQALERNKKNPEMKEHIKGKIESVKKTMEELKGSQQQLDIRLEIAKEKKKGFKF
jgi:hypothetical protein